MGSITEVDYLTQARSRYTQQFKNKPIFDAHINIFITEITEIQDMLQDLIGLRSLETAVGSQLDMIGAIVGQPRVLVNFTLFPFFGFDGASQAQTFGSLYDSALGGTWKSISDSEGASFEVDDDTYRFIIKARIVANISNTTPQGVIDAVNYIVSRTDSSIVEMGNAHLKITHYATLTTLQEYFLRGLSSIGSIIPLPICVSYEIESPSGLPKMLELLFNGADGSTITDSTGRHTPSLSAAGTRTIVSNRLQVGGGGFIRADAANTVNQDFNFTGKDFSISFDMQPTSGGTTWIFKKTSLDASGGGSPYLVFIGTTQLAFRSYNNQNIVTYTAPSTLVNVTTKVEIKRTGTTFQMLINDVVVDTQVYNEAQRAIDFSSQNYGMIVGASPPDGGLTGFIDNFVVRRAA